MNIRVILADDHDIMREGLRLILKQVPDVEIVGEAKDGREALDLVRKLHPQLVIMDIGMPNLNGVEATRQIVADDSDVKIIALSALTDKRYVLGMLEAGAIAYLVKSSAGDQLVQAIRSAMLGRRFISPQVADAVVDGYLNRGEEVDSLVSGPLAKREREILQMLAEGKTSKQIANTLGISVRTIETHRRNIMQKLDLHNLADLTRYAIREGLILPDR